MFSHEELREIRVTIAWLTAAETSFEFLNNAADAVYDIPERLLAGHVGKPYSNRVGPLRARVEKGRLVLDEPTTLPDGTVVDLVADDGHDDLNDEERRALNDALSASWKSAEPGDLRPVSAILNELRQRR